jgi:hypothetical protein
MSIKGTNFRETEGSYNTSPPRPAFKEHPDNPVMLMVCLSNYQGSIRQARCLAIAKCPLKMPSILLAG